MRDPKYPGVFWKTWGPALTAQRPEITMPTVDKFVTRMFETDPDFVFTVTRDFVRGCQTPILVLPDDAPAHPFAVAMKSAMLAPKAEVSMSGLGSGTAHYSSEVGKGRAMVDRPVDRHYAVWTKPLARRTLRVRYARPAG